jgi:nitrate reductase NapE component
MKRCPKCNRQYTDDSLRFCLEDGNPLTAITRGGEPPPTEILPRVPETQKMSAPTIPSYLGPDHARMTPSESRQSNPILTAGVIAIALLLLVLVGIVGYFVLRQSGPSESAKTNPSISPTPKVGSSPQGRETPDNREDATPTPPPNVPPLQITPSSSSVRLAVQANTYYPANTIDGKRATAWIEGVEGPGIGEWIRYDFDRPITLHRILFQPGYFKSPAIWAQNNRLATVTAQFSDGSSRTLNFDNRMESQKVDVGAVKTRWVRLVIESVYYGTDPDTAISEIAFEWEP